MRNEVFDLFACGFTQSFGAAEVRGVDLHQSGVELMLADDVAEPGANLGAAVVLIRWLRRRPPRFPRRMLRLGRGSNLRGRATADAGGPLPHHAKPPPL